MSKRLILVLLYFTISLWCFTVKSQKNVDTQSLLWMRYYLHIPVNNTYRIQQELEERTYWFPWRQHQLVSRTFVQRKLGKNWSTGLGFTYFQQSLPHNPEVTDYYNQSELRPQLELAAKQPLTTTLQLHHRYWAEFRYFETSYGSAYHYGNTRFRYKLELSYAPVSQLTLKAFDEIHVNIGNQIVQNVFDQNRYGGSIQYQPTKQLGFELGYLNWFQQRKSGVDFYNRNIIRFTLHHTLNFQKS